MKKELGVFVLICLVFVSGMVSAELRWAGGQYGVSDSETESRPFSFYKGWNLVQGFADPSFINGCKNGGEFCMNSIKAIFVLNPVSKEYYQVYPTPEKSKLDSLGPAILQNPFWVYSSEDLGEVSYSTEKLAGNFQIIRPAGWNFISLGTEMFGKTLTEIKGSCNIEKAYIWNSEKNAQEWQIWTDSIFTNGDLIRLGFIIKVSSDCILGSSDGSAATSPPSLPIEGSSGCTDTDGGLNYTFKGVVSGETAGILGVREEIDQCLNDTYIGEWYCSSHGVEGTPYLCPNKCLDGACI